MPKKFKEEEPKRKGILKIKKLGKNKMAGKAKKTKHVRIKRLDRENRVRLEMVRAELQARPGIVSTAATREAERVSQSLLNQRNLARARAASQGYLTYACTAVLKMCGFLK